jgi:hypothetical protein
MTAEIAILNKEAVAIAADSAVTIQRGDEQKIFTSANKIFSLSFSNPIAIMIYNNATLMGIPWEVIVKLYRETHGHAEFNTLEDAANSFIDFLRSELNCIPQDVQNNWVMRIAQAYYQGIKEDINKSVKKELEITQSITEEQVKQFTCQAIHKFYDFINDGSSVTEIPDDLKLEFRSEFSKKIKEAIPRVFEKLPISPKYKKMLSDIPYLLLTKYPNSFDFRDYTGVVIAGYGKLDIFPKLRTYMINGKFSSFLKYKIDKSDTVISHNNTATIVPFAQSDMVHTFMEGINNDLLDKMQEDIYTILKEYPKIILEKITSVTPQEKKKFLQDLQRLGREEHKKYIKRLKDYRQKNYVSPVIAVVSSLPKDELASMAESLVSITSFKRKISMELETVGGPIDVAVISKKDGFVWIKHKHYFEKELNHHFFHNYFQRSAR